MVAATATSALAFSVEYNAKALPPTHNCVTTSVQRVTTRLEKQDGSMVPGSGFFVMFSHKLDDPFFGPMNEGVVTYQGDSTNDFIATERPRDKVQVCLVAFPEYDTNCNPTKDPRGRTLRVFDYKNKYAYTGINSEHGCGGA